MIYVVLEKQDTSCYAWLFNRFCLIIFCDCCVKHEREKIPNLSKQKGQCYSTSRALNCSNPLKNTNFCTLRSKKEFFKILKKGSFKRLNKFFV